MARGRTANLNGADADRQKVLMDRTAVLGLTDGEKEELKSINIRARQIK